MSLKLYYDLMSQPSRAMYILFKTIKRDFESCYIDLRKGEHFTEAYSKINVRQKVPVINYNGFVLTESVAIINFLSRKGVIPDNLYPKDSRTRARVQEYLEWQHVGLRLHCAMYFRVKYMNPILAKEKPDPQRILPYEQRMEQALEEFNTKWLGRGNQFIVGDSVTIADLWAATELEQPRMAGYNPMQKFNNIGVWMNKVRAHFNPHYEEAHTILNKIVKKNEQKIESKL